MERHFGFPGHASPQIQRCSRNTPGSKSRRAEETLKLPSLVCWAPWPGLQNKAVSWATSEGLHNYCLQGTNIPSGLPTPVDGSRWPRGLLLFLHSAPVSPRPPPAAMARPALPDPIGVLDGQLTHDEAVPARHKALGSDRAV